MRVPPLAAFSSRASSIDQPRRCPFGAGGFLGPSFTCVAAGVEVGAMLRRFTLTHNKRDGGWDLKNQIGKTLRTFRTKADGLREARLNGWPEAPRFSSTAKTAEFKRSARFPAGRGARPVRLPSMANAQNFRCIIPSALVLKVAPPSGDDWIQRSNSMGCEVSFTRPALTSRTSLATGATLQDASQPFATEC